MKGVLLTSSLLILLIAALRPLLRGRIDPRIQYALWLAVALRLLIPVNLFTSAYSALALLQRGSEPARIMETIGQTSIPSQSYDSARAQVVEEYRRQGVSEAQLTPGDLMAIDTQARELMRGPTLAELTLAELAAKCARPLWLGGAAPMALWFTAVNLKLRRRLRGAERLELDCPLPVYLSDALPSPCLCGALRPRIYVTPAALESPDRLRHVLAHELAHYRHRDHWWALVRCACLCLYWFNPLVWWAAALSRQDCELACDEGAIRALGEGERIPYGRTLVGMIAAGRNPLLQTATTMTGGKRRVKERVTLIARKPKTVIALALALALILACAVGCAFSGAPERPMDAQRDPQLLDLPSRLNTLPEELGAKVSTQGTESGALATYRLSVPADWENPAFAYILSVYSFQKEGFQGWPDDSESSWKVVAQSGTHYYAVHRLWDKLYPSDYEYWDVHRAVREYVEKVLFSTEGVEQIEPGFYLNPRQSAEMLPERLQGIPAELQADVTALPGSQPTATLNDDFTALAQYWMNRPWADYDEIGMGWLLTVYRWDQAQFERYYPELEVTGGVNCFAKDDTFYYIIFKATDARAPLSETGYADAFEAVRAFAEKTVLETEGVEPYSPGQTADTLWERLGNIPQALRGEVVARDLDIVMDGSVLWAVGYWMNRPDWEELDAGLGWLLTIEQISQYGLSQHIGRDNSGWTCFACRGDAYFAITFPTDVRFYSPDDAEPYHSAQDAIRAFVEETVLSTQGVEPYTLGASFPDYTIPGMDYTPVNSYEDLPDDPEQWYLVGQLPQEPVWMFSRGYGEETMFQVGGHLTQVYPYTARVFGGGQTHDGAPPQLLRLEGGLDGFSGAFAVITHIFQGGTDQMYRLTVYDLDADPQPLACVHDWKALMDDFNAKRTIEVDEESRTEILSYGGQTLEIPYREDDPLWKNYQEYGFSAQLYDTGMKYTFNSDGTANLLMAIEGPPTHCACWTVRFADGGFETVGFQFVETPGDYW